MTNSTYKQFHEMDGIISTWNVGNVKDASGHSTKYGYDSIGRLTSMEQQRQLKNQAGIKYIETRLTTYERDKKGQVISVTSPLISTAGLTHNLIMPQKAKVSYEYDKTGQVISKLDEDGLTTLYEYSLAGNLEKVSYADGKAVEFSYNALGQLKTMKDHPRNITNLEHQQT